jgi:CMP-N,N'-diacetyllegionaminic acid synthase
MTAEDLKHDNLKTEILAIIPARGGSKGIPNKNLKVVNGMPLIGWTIEQAKASALLTEIFVSTDSLEIAEYSENLGISAKPLRPTMLATDTATTIDTVVHVLENFKKIGRNFEFVFLLEPTSPLRKKSDIDECIQSLWSRKNSFDALITLGRGREHPSLLRLMLDSGQVETYLDSDLSESRRQDLPTVYFPFGVAYLIKVDTLYLEKSFYPQKTLGFLLDDWQCFEVDNPIDLILVEKLVEIYGNS